MEWANSLQYVWKGEKMEIREYRPEDCAELTRLFYDTVHTVNRRDYAPAQLDAWADGSPDLDAGTGRCRSISALWRWREKSSLALRHG